MSIDLPPAPESDLLILVSNRSCNEPVMRFRLHLNHPDAVIL